MKFCKGCANMLYLKLSIDEDEDASHVLLHVCKNCGLSEAAFDGTSTTSFSVLETYLESSGDEDAPYKSKYIMYDPTLPRVKNIPCPNSCDGSQKDPNTIYIKVDPVQLKYLYFCTHCEHFWHSK